MKISTLELHIAEDEAIAFVGDLHADLTGPASRLDDYLHTIVNKLSSILRSCITNNVQAVIFSGDMFSRLAVSHECVNTIGQSFMEFKKNNIRVFSIVGNHDIARNNMERLMKSPLKTLFTFEVVEHINLTNRIVINRKTLITPVDYTESPIPALGKAKYNILVAHMFYNSSELFAAGKHNITEDDLKAWNYDCVMLGHDHVPYPLMQIGKTSIVRPGSVMRATSHEYNHNRTPKFYILRNPAEYNTVNFELIDIEAKPFMEIASNTVINKQTLNDGARLNTIMSDLADRISNVEITSANDDRVVEFIKNDPKVPNEVRQLLFNYFTEHGIQI